MVQEFHLVPVDSGWGQSLRPEDIISQAEMAELEQDRVEVREKNTRNDQRRTSFIDRLERGAVVEPGPISPKIMTRESRYYSRKALIEMVGESQEQELHQRLTPRTTKTLLLLRDDDARQSRRNPPTDNSPYSVFSEG